jgi:Zn-dependent protease
VQGSIRLGSVFGIQVRMHWLFALVVALMVWFAAWRGVDPQATLVWIAVMFGLVLLHELGHCLVARRFGIRVLDITLWPLGGMARMSEIPEKPRVEALIAIAGPAVNLLLAFLALPVWIWGQLAAHSAGATAFDVRLWLAAELFLVMNVVLGVFNLVPAFPMDGGRMLRAWLARRGDWLRATESAVRTGRVLALSMIALGFYWTLSGANLLPLVGLFVWVSGSQELAAVRARRAPRGRLHPFAFAGFDRFDAPPATSAPEDSPDPSGARRPEPTWWSTSDGRTRGISAADLERLERYRGPLRRPSPD